MSEELEKRKKQLRGLFKDLSEEELTAKAQEALDKKNKIKDVDLDDIFVEANEKRYANELLAKYLKEYIIESVSDKNTLRSLIYLEIINYRLQEALNNEYKTEKRMDKETLELIHKNQDKILALKTSLGLTRDKKNDNSKDAYGYLQLVKKKFKIWLQENQASRTLCCPYCAKMFFLKIKTDAWEAQKHPFFADRMLGNKHLMKLYIQNKLTKEDIAQVFETSPEYIVWLLEKWKSNPDYKDLFNGGK